MSTLLEMIQTKLSYVMQEAIIVIKDIFRKYPNKYESIISTLCENLYSLDEPKAQSVVGIYKNNLVIILCQGINEMDTGRIC